MRRFSNGLGRGLVPCVVVCLLVLACRMVGSPTIAGEQEPVPPPTAEKLSPVAESPAKKPSEKSLGFRDYVKTPTVQWLPKPRNDIPEARAGCEAEMRSYTEIVDRKGTKFDMIPIPGGTFRMGSPADEPHRAADEGPLHEVRVEPFWMGRHEVTWDEFENWSDSLDQIRRRLDHIPPTPHDRLADALTCPSCIPYGDPTFGMGHDGYPAIMMTHFAARCYTKWLSAATGRYYRLPTEAEWEYACRAGTKTAYSFGDDPEMLDQYACYFDNSEDGYHKVGTKRPNPWGLYDMHGNVAEWVLDQHVHDFYRRSTGRVTANPLAVPTSVYPCVVRGGSWDDDPDRLRSASRRGSTKDWSILDPQIPPNLFWHFDTTFVGLRVVRPLRQPTIAECRRLEKGLGNQREKYLEAIRGER